MTETPSEPAGPRPFEYYQAPPPVWQQQGPPKPGTIPLRPLSLGEVLAGSIATIRRNWRIMVLVPFVVALVLAAVQIPISSALLESVRAFGTGQAAPRPEDVLRVLGNTFAGTGITSLAALLLSMLVLGVLTVTISRAVLGQQPTFGEALRAAGPRYLPLIGLIFVMAIIEVLAVVLPTAVGIGIGSLVGTFGAIFGFALLGFLAGAVLAAYLGVSFMLAPTALILEPQPVFRSLSRSRWLVRGHWWRLAGVTLVAGLLAGAVSIALQMPVSIWQGITTFQTMTINARTPVLASQLPSLPQMIVGGLFTAIATAMTTPFVNGVTVLLYHDQRIRLERFDIPLAQMAAAPEPA